MRGRNKTKKFREAAYDQQGGLCYWCKAPMTQTGATQDHLVRLADGGKHVQSNIVAACKPCNTSRHGSIPSCGAKLGDVWPCS